MPLYHAVCRSPVESSSAEAEELRSFLRGMEEDRTVMGELILTLTKLSPHLNQAKRAAAQIQQIGLQEEWRSLERASEKTLYCVNGYARETSSLLAEISSLQEQLEVLGKATGSPHSTTIQWDSKRAQELMMVNAELTAAQQKYLYLQQSSEALVHSSQWEKETKQIEQGLQQVKEQLDRVGEQVSSQTPSSDNPIMNKIHKVMMDAFAWAKQTESDIEGRRRKVALLPEEVHRQIKDLKKVQWEMAAKQAQLEALVEEVEELLPELDQADEVPMVHSSLVSLESLSRSTTEKLAKAVKEIESGLQTRENMSEQIADLDSWVVSHLHREASRRGEGEGQSTKDLDRRVRQIQETLVETEKQAAVSEALLMRSRDIASELSITENCRLNEKLTNLQEDIKSIISYEKANQQELEELLQTQDASRQKVTTVEKSLRQMLVDLNRHRFPVTRETLSTIEPFKHMIVEHKCQVDKLQPFIPEEKKQELLCVISQLHCKMSTLNMKAKEHERYLTFRQCVEELRENVEEQVLQTKEENRGKEERYTTGQVILTQLPLIKRLCEEAADELQSISQDLYPSQLTAEHGRLKQNLESFQTWEMTVINNIQILEWGLLKEVHLQSEQRAVLSFLRDIQRELQQPCQVEPTEEAVDKEHWRIVTLRMTVECRLRVLKILERKKGTRQQDGSPEYSDLMDLKNAILNECDLRMASCFVFG